MKEAKKKQEEIINLLKVGSFPIRKWSSNEAELVKWLPSEMLAVAPLVLFDNSTSLAILGISWRPHNDKFRFEIDVQPLSSVVTKRSILSSIARIFDPMGWLSFIVISVKILLQSLWLLKVGWDDALPDHIVFGNLGKSSCIRCRVFNYPVGHVIRLKLK